MSSARHAVNLRRDRGRHRRPSRTDAIVPAGVTGGVLFASVLGGVATAAPAAAQQQGTTSTSSSSSGATQSSSVDSGSLPSLSKLLTSGSSGNRVEMVQEKLDITTDGIFGPETEAAVKEFQRNNDLKVDGVVGPETWGALGGEWDGSSSGGTTQTASSGSSDSSDESDSSGSGSLVDRAIELASQQEGDPYVWGAEGPDSFDCSGLTQFVYEKLGYELPRTAEAQYAAVEHVDRDDLQRGDLVFLENDSGHIYHVGIYAGDGEWWAARKPGTTVTKQDAYWKDGGYNWKVGRVG